MAPRTTRSPRTPATRKPRQSALTAKTADKHELYQRSVQNAGSEVEFIERTFRRLVGREPISLREDFCGTALLAAAWANSGHDRWGIGIDIDKRVLEWGRAHNLTSSARDRVTLHCQDVRERIAERVDLAVAFNFSYWVFTTRPEMRHYFEQVRRGLVKGGLFLVDAYGGWESQEPRVHQRRIRGGFTYAWEQAEFDPITHRVKNHIHFRFQNGSKLERAFTYDWRFWTIPELRELLEEAGFREVSVYWDTSPDDKSVAYRRRERATNHPSWLAYVIGRV